MTFAMGLTFAILIAALIMFILDIYPIDFVAFSVMALVLVLGPILKITPQEAISGFSNPATITVLAMFILSAGIYQTGVVNRLAHHMLRLSGRSHIKQLLVVMFAVGPISAFINNAAAVAILIPSVITLARKRHRAPSKLLIPLSYFSQLAGAVTLVGTSSNILASALSAKAGLGGFTMFEFSHIGLLVFTTGAIYLLFIAPRLLPEHRGDEPVIDSYQIKSYLSEVIVLEDSPLIGKSVVENRLGQLFDIDVLEIIRTGQRLHPPLDEEVFQPGDILFVKANAKQLLRIKDMEGLAIEPEMRLSNRNLTDKDRGLLEVEIGPNSPLIGGTLESNNFRNYFNCTVIAIQKRGELVRERLSQVSLNFGDMLLVQGAKSALEQLKREPGLIVTEEVEPEAFRREKTPLAIAILAGVVIVAALGQSILVTAIAGCVLMVWTGCLKVNELHEAIQWNVIFLLAGIIPLGLALQRTGGTDLLAGLATYSADFVPPLIVLVIVYALTVLMAELVSHTAAVVVMVPVGIAVAQTLGLNPRAFVLASMFAASMSFSTPVGYHTNTMVYGPGGYKFLDFTRVGLPLSLVMTVVTPLYIYLVWGL